jgi:RecB family exonuclease
MPNLRKSTRPRWHSVSSTREYEGCPRRYHFGYVERRPKDRPVPPSWRFGTVVHAALEAAWRATMTDPSRPVAEHLDLALAALDESLAEERLEDPADRERAVAIVRQTLTEDVLRADHAVRPVPIGVEEAMRGYISDTDRIIGFIDLVLEHADGSLELVDHKVTAHRATPTELIDDFQLNLYGQLASRRWPDATRILATLHYPTGPTAVTVELDAHHMHAADARVRAAAADIRADDQFGPTPSERCGHCPWIASCPEGSAWFAVHGTQAAPDA